MKKLNEFIASLRRLGVKGPIHISFETLDDYLAAVLPYSYIFSTLSDKLTKSVASGRVKIGGTYFEYKPPIEQPNEWTCT